LSDCLVQKNGRGGVQFPTFYNGGEKNVTDRGEGKKTHLDLYPRTILKKKKRYHV